VIHTSSGYSTTKINSGKVIFIACAYQPNLVFHDVKGIQQVGDVLANTLSDLSYALDLYPNFVLRRNTNSAENNNSSCTSNHSALQSTSPTQPQPQVQVQKPQKPVLNSRVMVLQVTLALIASVNVLFMLAIFYLIFFVYAGQDLIIIIVIGFVGSLSIVEWLVIVLRQTITERLADEEGRCMKLAYFKNV